MPKRDKDKPKGKTSAYAYFVQDQKELLKSRGESLDFSAFSKSCSEEWKKVKDKTKFVKKAETDKERYEREMEDYIPASDSKDAKKSKKKTKDVNAPKRALSGFMFFSQETRAEIKKGNAGASVGEVAKELGKRWKKMELDERAPFEEMAKSDRDRYLQEITEYREGGSSASGGRKSPQKRGRKAKKTVAIVEEEDDEDEEEEEEEDEDSSD